MKIIIAGAKDRCSEEDRLLVIEIIELASKMYPNCIFGSVLTHEGVGLFAKQKCLEKGTNGQFKYQFIEITVKLYATLLNKAEVSGIYIARNATALELCDMLIYLANADRRGMMEDLVNRVVAAGRPCLVLLPGDKARLPEVASADTSVHRKCTTCPHEVIEHGPGGCMRCVCKNEVDV